MASTDESVQEESSTVRQKPLWRNRDFMLLWSGQTVSTIGTGISQFAFPLLVLALSGSPALAGLAAAAGSLPYLFLSLPAGALIDRWDRKKVMILCDTGRALNIASVPLAWFLGHLSIVQLFCVSFIEGVFFVFFNIAQIACLPRVVSNEQLPQATAQNEVTTSISELASPPLGGVLFSLGQAFPFLADAISYAASVFSLLLIKADFQQERKATQLNLFQQITEGLSWLWNQPIVRFMAFLTGTINLLTAGSSLIVIVVAQRAGASSFVIGIIFAVASIGSILGSLAGGNVQKLFSFGTVIIGSCFVIALLFPLYAIMPNPLLLGVVTAGIFLVIPLYNVVQISYRLALIPDHLQGRVNSVFRMLAFGFIPLGQALTGLSLQRFGPVPTILLTALGLVATAVIALLNPHIRHAHSSDSVEE
jgi:predicted MFS family arabinose efflux permease